MAKEKPAKPKQPKKPKGESRIFEELIARIETTLAGPGVTVTPGEWLIDKVTGSRRQVDATIRLIGGSSAILIVIECRKRSKFDDATWIEQLGSRQRDIGADKTIAVSSKGFTEPAKTKAAFYGIELRQIVDFTAEELENWKGKYQIGFGYVEYQIPRALVQFKPPNPGLQMSEPISEAISKDPFNTDFVFRKSDDGGISINLLLDKWEEQYGPFNKGLILGESRTTEVRVNFKDSAAYCRTMQGDIDIDFVLLTVIVIFKEQRYPLQRVSRYGSENRVFAHVAESVIELAGGQKIEVIIPNVDGD
jgi:hypothetical protein